MEGFSFTTPRSSMIAEVSWSPGAEHATRPGSLLVRFRKGDVRWIYFKVPHATALALLEAYTCRHSLGRAFNLLVKREYKGDRYE